jgi:hypothetical protein
VIARVGRVSGDTPPSSLSLYCTPACKQLACRLRHQRLLPTVNIAIIYKHLQRQRLLVAHTRTNVRVAASNPSASGVAPKCQVFGLSVGLGATCPDRNSVILLADLVGLEVAAPS